VTADAAPPPAPRPPEAEPARSPSGSTIAYLFADRFVPTESAGKTGMRAFGTGQVVVTAELAGGLVAIGLWQLRERGAVTLDAYSGKKLGLIKVSGVRVRLSAGAGDVVRTAGGVEQRLLEHLGKSRKARDGGETAWDIANIVCMDGKEPRNAVIGRAIDEAVALGYLDRVKGEVGVIGRLAGRGSAKLEPVDDRLATLAPAALKLAAQWRSFREREADLAKLLRSTTFEGIESRARRRDGSSADD